ncbi:hypothetical protein ACUNV4_28375 [Granulosicoccus sp. 3-233]|uniref:hypothetical protein n=1 Tax=Granulosicoccus sp. 3-233 TaxID=3417969 RepID=UPI003D356E6E
MDVRHFRGVRLVWLSLLLLLSGNGFVHAQSVDTVAPIIELEELTEGIADRTQVFTAQVAEDNTLDNVTLYYRREGQLPFTPAPMEALGNTGYYSVSIPTDFNDLRTIEYYVQAIDTTGNRTVSGFAFDPYQRTLSAPVSPISGNQEAAPEVAAQERIPLLKRRWVQITLGVLAVGAVASLVSDDGEDSEVVPLTFSLQ